MARLIQPTRRKLLKSAPLVLAAPAILRHPAAARLLRGSANTTVTPYARPLPAPAAEVGFNTVTMFDDFDSPDTIDVNNALTSNFKWFVTNTCIPQDSPDGTQAAGVTQQPASVSLNGSILTFSPTANSGGWLTSAGYTGVSGSRFVGSLIAPTGGYFEIKMAFDPTKNRPDEFTYPFTYWPAFWMEDWALSLAINDQNTASVNRPELDFFEYFGNFGLGAAYGFGLHDWTDNIHNVSTIGSAYDPTLAPDSWAGMHTYGTRWRTQAQNGGTGLIERYFDGVHIAAADVTYSSSITSPDAGTGAFTGVFSDLDTSVGFAIQFGTGPSWPIYVDYVIACQ